jgi:hypothetical protein
LRLTVEECAGRILQREIGCAVRLNDDGSAPRMYDLRVGDLRFPDVAVECVGAVDRVRTETWNVGPARGLLSLNLHGDWGVQLRPHARVKPILAVLEALLRNCEQAGLEWFTHVDAFLNHREPDLFAALNALNIASVHCACAEGTGTVYLGMTGFGGAVDTEGRAVAGWISEFLRAPDQEDVLLKLRASGAAECHAFVAVSFGGVPWPVESYLGTHTDHLPDTAPDLPPPVSAVWIMYGRNGVRWDGKGWCFFDATVPAAQ